MKCGVWNPRNVEREFPQNTRISANAEPEINPFQPEFFNANNANQREFPRIRNPKSARSHPKSEIRNQPVPTRKSEIYPFPPENPMHFTAGFLPLTAGYLPFTSKVPKNLDAGLRRPYLYKDFQRVLYSLFYVLLPQTMGFQQAIT